MDSGAKNHIVRDHDLFVQFSKISQGTKFVYVGNNVRLEVERIGTCNVPIKNGKSLVFINCLYVPMICRNLVFVTCLLHFGFQLDFYGDVHNIHFGNDILCTCSLGDGIYIKYNF